MLLMANQTVILTLNEGQKNRFGKAEKEVTVQANVSFNVQTQRGQSDGSQVRPQFRLRIPPQYGNVQRVRFTDSANITHSGEVTNIKPALNFSKRRTLYLVVDVT